MARSRNIKPGFFKNDLLAEVDPLGRLLFAGLWTIADREGRLEDRPKRIKAEILPYDDCDIIFLLDELEKKCFIKRYSVEEEEYIQITGFNKHQNPHNKEQPSVIPPPEEDDTSTMQARVKYGASMGQEQDEPGSCRADSLNLIPDSLNPIESSPKRKRFTPPTVEEVKNYCVERQNNVDPEKFVDYYEANGWMRGKTKIKDWKACVRTWEKNEFSKPVNGVDKKPPHKKTAFHLGESRFKDYTNDDLERMLQGRKKKGVKNGISESGYKENKT